VADDVRSAVTPSRSDSNESGIRRREVLRTALNLGATGGLVWTLGRDYISSTAGTITYALARPEPDSGQLEPRTKEVPPVWHESLRLAFEAQDRLQSAGFSPLVDSFVVPGTYDNPLASLSVGASRGWLADRIDNLIDAVPVDVEIVDVPSEPQTETDVSEAYQLSELNKKWVAGGVLCKTRQYFGTLSPAIFDTTRKQWLFATSNHLYGEYGTKKYAHRGEPLFVVFDSDEYHIGNVKQGYPVADIVTIEPANGFRPAPAVERAPQQRLVGHYTRFGLADLAAQDEPLMKVGAMTGRTSGTIDGIDGLTCYTGRVCKSGQLKWGDRGDMSDGDSGSVNFHSDPENPDDYALAGGINNARTWWPMNFTWGTAAYHLYDTYGITF